MQSVLGRLRTAEFGARFMARFMDGFIVFAVAAVIAGLGAVLLPDDGWFRAPWDHPRTARSALAFVYEAGFLVAWGTTPGKRRMNLEVVDAMSGERVRPVAAVVRTAAWMGAAWVPVIGFGLPVLFVLPILWTGFGIHDYIARTWVVTRVDDVEEFEAPVSPSDSA